MKKHVPGLDGLRGAAVAAVLLFHDGGRLRGGYLGVDLFFVLSGFLITSILQDEWRATSRIDLKAFWIRRARRLLPALLSLMPAIAIYAKWRATKSELAPLRADALATLGYVANWRAIFAKRSYWEMFTAPSPLEHTWSLAIEEQFYVVWPLVVVLVLRFAKGRMRALAIVTAVLAALSIMTMLALYDGGDTTRVYLGTDTRGAAILLGALLASSGITARTAGAWLDGLGVIAFVSLGVAWGVLDGENPFLYRGGFWLTELAGVVLVACCVMREGKGLVARVFSFAPIRALGVISYGVYLWHWPVYVVLGGRSLVLRLVVTLVIAIVSYRFLERPIRRNGLRFGRPIVIVPAAFALAAALVFAATRVDAKPEARDPLEAPAVASAVLVPKEIKFPPSNVFPLPEDMPKDATRALVLGDSVAMSLGARMYWARHPDDAFVVQRGVGDCSILDGIVPVHSMGGEPHGNGNCARAWVDDVTELRPDVTLVLLGGAFFSIVKSHGRWRNVCEPGWREPFVSHFADLLREIVPFTKRVLVVTAPIPVGKWESATLAKKNACFNTMLHDAATNARVEILDLAEHLCPAQTCTLMTDEHELVRFDGLHFGGAGSDATVRWVLGAIRGSRTPSSVDKMFDAGSP